MNNQKKLNILIAEDDYLVCEMIQGMVTDLGHTVAGIVTTGSQAVEKTMSIRPDIIIMDVKMPDMDGIDASNIIQQQCPTPIVILTAFDSPELVEQASQAGVHAYLLKPPDRQELARVITLAIARYKDLQALQHLSAKLQASVSELDAFSHTVAHDLQGPLGLIIGFAEFLQQNDEELAKEKKQEMLQIIVQNARKMSNIIDELMLLAGIRKKEVNPREVDMALTAYGAKQRLVDAIQSHQAEIIMPEKWPIVIGYEPWIEEVWVNYLSNGIKYGGRPPKLEVGYDKEKNGFIRFWVRDNGAGISKEKQKDLFSMFTRLDQAKAKGQGLGLSIVQRIIVRLGGEVGVESKEGAGSLFWFSLPAK
ncbi:MAG: response regulator [Candidatus Promineifilaceae bacterium]